jgi:hypothetical protein
MMDITDFFKQKEEKLKEDKTIEAFCYFFCVNKQELNKLDTKDFEEKSLLSVKGYKSLPVNDTDKNILTQPPIKSSLDYSKDIFKLLGIYLAFRNDVNVKNKVEEKFNKPNNIRHKYLIQLVDNSFQSRFIIYLKEQGSNDSFTILLKTMYLGENIEQKDSLINQMLNTQCDTTDLILLKNITKQQYQLFMSNTQNTTESKKYLVWFKENPYKSIVGLLIFIITIVVGIYKQQLEKHSEIKEVTTNNTFTVKGRVVYEGDNTSVSLVQIFINNSPTKTDSEGKFTLNGVTIDKGGILRFTINTTILNRDTAQYQIKNNIIEISEVITIPKRKK